MKKFWLSVAVFALMAPAVRAQFIKPNWTRIPLEILVDEADLIVVGKVTKLFRSEPRRPVNTAVEVSRIIKSLPGIGQPKTVHIPGAVGLDAGPPLFQVGQEGIWLLTKDPDRKDPDSKVYWAKDRAPFLEQVPENQVAAVVKARAKLAGGQAVNGLVARAEVVEYKTAIQVRQVRFSLKNVSEKPITICDFPGHKPLKVDWAGPEGTKLKSVHYSFVPTRLAKNNFVTIPPGGVRFLCEAGSGFVHFINEGGAGILFQPPTLKLVSVSANTAPVGRHKVTVSFASQQDGKQFQLMDVWTGTVTANEVSFEIKK